MLETGDTVDAAIAGAIDLSVPTTLVSPGPPGKHAGIERAAIRTTEEAKLHLAQFPVRSFGHVVLPPVPIGYRAATHHPEHVALVQGDISDVIDSARRTRELLPVAARGRYRRGLGKIRRANGQYAPGQARGGKEKLATRRGTHGHTSASRRSDALYPLPPPDGIRPASRARNEPMFSGLPSPGTDLLEETGEGGAAIVVEFNAFTQILSNVPECPVVAPKRSTRNPRKDDHCRNDSGRAASSHTSRRRRMRVAGRSRGKSGRGVGRL